MAGGRVNPISIPVRLDGSSLPGDAARALGLLGGFTKEVEAKFRSLASDAGIASIGSTFPPGQATQVSKLIRSASRGNMPSSEHQITTQAYLSEWQRHADAGMPGAAANVQTLQTLLQRQLLNTRGPLTNLQQIASPLWNNQQGLATGSIAGDQTSNYFARRIINAEQALESGGAVSPKMVEGLREAEQWFRKLNAQGNEYFHVLARIKQSTDVIGNILPPEAQARRSRLGPGGMDDVRNYGFGVQQAGDWYGGESLRKLEARQQAWDEGAAHNRWRQEQGPIGPSRPVGPNSASLRNLTDADKRAVEPRWQNDGQRARFNLLQSLKDDGSEFDLSSLQRRLAANQAMAARGLVTSSMGHEDEFLLNRISAIQSNPVLNRMGTQSKFRGNSLTAMNIGYGLEDFVIASQYGGIPMGIRAAVNNVTPIIATAMMSGKLAGWAGPAAIGGAAIAASGVAIGTEMYQRSVERARQLSDEGIETKMDARRFAREIDRPIERMERRQGMETIQRLSRADEKLKDEADTIKEQMRYDQHQYDGSWSKVFGADSAHHDKVRERQNRLVQIGNERMLNSRQRRELTDQLRNVEDTSRFNRDYDASVYNQDWRQAGRNWSSADRGTIGQLNSENQFDLEKRIRATQDTFNKSDRGRDAQDLRNASIKSAQSDWAARRLDIRKQGREQFEDIREHLRADLRNLPGEIETAREITRKILGNDTIGNQEKLDNLLLNRDVLSRNIKNLRTGEGNMLPEQEAFETGTMAHAQFVRRLTSPQETVDEKILQVLNDINDAIQELRKKLGLV